MGNNTIKMDVLNKTIEKEEGVDIKDYYLPKDISNQNYREVNNAVGNESPYVMRYGNYAVYYPPNSAEYHTDNLFNRMIEYCMKRGFVDYKNDEVPIINPQLRDSFSDFVWRMTC